ncbi:unnamed protein product [Ranitomeya imitator]|uniref:Sulfotransferase n=1 Tax=Ranitomeya imitator TaxID=111125 RepID=A0ABN9LB87_9NEOB|nr:unnamed protein product [Ranitomeya imitator]
MNSAVYQRIPKENVRPSVRDIKLKRTWVMQQDNDLKHTIKSTSEWLKNNKIKILEWPSQSPDHNVIEMLWQDLKKGAHAWKPSNVAELNNSAKMSTQNSSKALMKHIPSPGTACPLQSASRTVNAGRKVKVKARHRCALLSLYGRQSQCGKQTARDLTDTRIERYRQIPPQLYQELKSMLSQMLQKGVIRESQSPWAAPTVLLFKVSPVSKLSNSDETKKAPTHVLILSSWRSGSSFIGQIFNHHPDVFYLFEPGHSVWMRFRKEGAKLLHYAKVKLCVPYHLAHFLYHRKAINRSKCFQQCKRSTFDEMEKACGTYSHRVMKTVRILDYSVLLPLFRDPALDLRIIHLVRDPRAIASSRKHFDLSVDDPIVLKEHDTDTKGPVMATICKAQANINKMVNTAGDYLKRRYLLVRHEDLSREPIANTKKIYEFSGLKMTPDLEQWGKERTFMTFSRKSSNVVQQWRKTMDFNYVKEIEEYCKEAMALFGYLPVGSKSDQQNMNLDFVS